MRRGMCARSRWRRGYLGCLVLLALWGGALASAPGALAAMERLRIDWSGGPTFVGYQWAPYIVVHEVATGRYLEHRCPAPASGGPTPCSERGYGGSIQNVRFDDTNYRSIAFIDDEVPSTRCFRFEITHGVWEGGAPPYLVTATITDPDGTKRVSHHVLESDRSYTQLGTSPPTCPPPGPPTGPTPAPPPQANLSLETVDLLPGGRPARDVDVGDPLTYRTTITNEGPNPATSVELNDRLDDSVQLIEARTEDGTCEDDGRAVACPVGTLGVGEQATVEIDVIPEAKIPGVRASGRRPRQRPLPRILKPEDRTLRKSSRVTSGVLDPIPSDNRETEGTRVGSARVPQLKTLRLPRAQEAPEVGDARARASRHATPYGSIPVPRPDGGTSIIYSGSVTNVMHHQWTWSTPFESNTAGFFAKRICRGVLRRLSAWCRALDAAKIARRARYRWFLANAAWYRDCFGGYWDRFGKWHFFDYRPPAWGLSQGTSGKNTRCTYPAVYWLRH